MATRALLVDLTSAAVVAGLKRGDFESVGGVHAAQRVAAGERFDIVVLAYAAVLKLAEDGHVETASVTPLVLSPTAVAVRAGRGRGATSPPAEPAFDDAASVRAALRHAERIGYSTGPSGTALLEQIANWGMADEMRDRLVRARPGIPVARLIAEGEVDIGFQQRSEMVEQEGIHILGVLPSDCAIDTVFAGAIATTTTDRSASQSLLSFFASRAVDSIKWAHSFDSVLGKRSCAQQPI